ncbi:MAG: ATP-binding protein [Terriglobales bacterium]
MSSSAEPASVAGGNLSDAFVAFTAAANRLERSHAELHAEVSYLRGQLEDRNRKLAASVAETERMRAALSNTLDELPCGVVVVKRRSREIVLANPEAYRLLGMPPKEALLWETLPSVVQTALQALDCDDPSPSGEIEVSIDSSGEQWLALRCAAMGSTSEAEETDGESRQSILILRDITAQKQSERDREASRRMAALAEVATVLAHEIRNPLGSMELMAGLLGRDPALGDDSRHWVLSLQAGVRSLSATVNNVLSFHSNGSLHLVPIKIGRTLRSALDFVRPLAEQAGVRLEVRDETEDVEIAGDAGAIQQVILNLTCNALRHTPAGGRITVCARVETQDSGRMVIVQFADTGNGISSPHVERLFEPGFSTTSQSPGLGLAVCRRIIRQHNSVITAASPVKRGAMFHMEFPVL